jgi:predicted dehydrogenase
MHAKLNLGVIGLGSYFSLAYLTELASPDSPFRVAAVCRRDTAAAKPVAEKLQTSAVYSDWNELLAHEGLDAVLISTPHHLHYEQTRKALQKGLHVLVDKPLCLDSRQAEELIRLAERQRLVLSVAYNYHYWPCFQKARTLIREGAIGAVQSVACLGTAKGENSPILDDGSWYHNPALSGGGSLISGGTHRLDAVFWLTGLTPTSVFASMRGPSVNLDYQAALVIELSNGKVASLLNEAQGQEWRLEIFVHGTEGSLHIHNQTLELRGAKVKDPGPLPPETSAIQDFYNAVVHGTELLGSGIDGYWATAAVEAAYRSAACKECVQVRQLNLAT